ncbi:hypothetical protein ANOM_001704 [Aspergillus nomiae NRRL 13137]|uniref:Uncharacterized protein n=1 Tax=Aspergillus nomiae NRRL (strain ATCC 15546 / NRRL 13137 / CBS 260.88 / M93) TaxID=1509407 RepID=A0A0L1JDU6_ASPN3|nr:uncharacterized protein ANOM_001704 [Aspergillus nomiae NRRL 13137]KNG89892.1 hypothetical protein ANOM_001704 [Aspergillus nomiae NRRL 13137]
MVFGSSKKKSKEGKPLADPSAKWGITPSEETMNNEVGKDHPVHKIPLEKQEKMRAKGVDPVSKAEMDEALKGQGGFWAKLGMTALGGGVIK